MNARNLELPPPPPGAIPALVNGFNAVAGHVGVILFPFLFDLFLWLGPILRPTALFAPVFDLLKEMPSSEQANMVSQLMKEFADGYNLFATARTFPLGIFSLYQVNLSSVSPLGERLGLTPSTWLLALLALFGLVFLGWVGGSLYFRAVAGIVVKGKAVGFARGLFNGILLSAIWLFLFLVANLPMSIFLALLGLFDSVVRSIIILLLTLPISWLLIAVFFSTHSIYLNASNAFVSIWKSFRLLRYGLPSMGWFTVLAIVINQGLNVLWRIPPADSWMALVGIFGHAFISTSLLAASFFYYKDMNQWIEAALEWLKTQNTSSARA